jgi:hypothetical protein
VSLQQAGALLSASITPWSWVVLVLAAILLTYGIVVLATH